MAMVRLRTNHSTPSRAPYANLSRAGALEDDCRLPARGPCVKRDQLKELLLELIEHEMGSLEAYEAALECGVMGRDDFAAPASVDVEMTIHAGAVNPGKSRMDVGRQTPRDV